MQRRTFLIKQRVLITGGAGFIGSFLTDALIEKGYNVSIFDNLEKQVHHGKKPPYINKKATLVRGDVRSYDSLKRAVLDADIVFHLAARVGVGQANYQIKDYVDTNIGGMANLLDIIVNEKTKVKKIIMTSSMTSYGEGMYSCSKHGKQKIRMRPDSQMITKQWELLCPTCKEILTPIPTPESAELQDNGIYSIGKHVQEQLLLFIGKMYRIPVVSLRLFNVYGPRQSLSNPYTGVAAIFISRLKNNRQPIVFEDGGQTRDFVSVHDVVNALLLAMENADADYSVFNIGSGKPTSVKTIATTLAKLLKKDITPSITNDGRKGDIRHCFADASKAEKILGWKPHVSFEEGMKEVVSWSEKEDARDIFERAAGELSEKKLMYE
ncbi:MAG: SDR family NAD(P)-dependent oxidoreductase [Candidatus Levybacteria bacterium]|nr:SDR family NAD(P)-dependent oxidoreductase [Candidatus Levybacteria bacterium]